MSTTERRAGQRWRCVSPSGSIDEGTIDGVMTNIGTWRMLGAKEDYWSDSYRWGGRNGFEMTLLSDVPAPQPKPACGAPEGYVPCDRNCGQDCYEHRVPPLPATPVPAANDSGTAPPAWEAPKVPVCMWHERHKCNPPVRERVVKVGAISLCDWAMHQNEKLIARKTEGSGTTYTGPERLPNPRLAVDYVDDCLGEV